MADTLRRFTIRSCSVVLALVVSGLAFSQSLHAQTQTAKTDCGDQTPQIAVISAFEPELERLRKETQVSSTCVLNGRRHYMGRLAGHDVVLLLTGYSMVNASLTTQALLDHFVVREIVFSGIAGGVNPNLHVGDVTVPAAWGQYQEQRFARRIPGGWDTGDHLREFSHYGMMFPDRVRVVHRSGEPDRFERRFWFLANEQALATVRGIASQVSLSRCTAGNVCLKTTPRLVIGGKGVSGPTFVDNAEYRRWVWRTFHADALDMETAAVATAAYMNEVPFIAFRSLSDLAGGGGKKNEESVFFQVAADNSAAVVLAYLRAIPSK
jgi:adenosylhomocysteine nucleosidase